MIKTAYQYHRDTGYTRGRIQGHYLDWPNQPDVFKEYQGINQIYLPEEIPAPKKSLLSILKETAIDSTFREIDINDLALILRLTCCLTAKARHSGKTFYYRSSASAGALYPTEIYVATSKIKGLDDGLYHFEIHSHSLSPLRAGDLADHISKLTFHPDGKLPTLTFVFTAISFRSSWKYRDRAYRYNLLDTGHVMENLFIAMKALKLPLDVSYDFNDVEVNKLIGVDGTKEVALAVAAVSGPGTISDSGALKIEELPENILNMSIVSGQEKDYPIIGKIHKAGEMLEARDDPEPYIPKSLALIPETWQSLPGPFSRTEDIDYPECLFMRRSSRNFVNAPIAKGKFYSLLDSLCLNDPTTLKIEAGRPHPLCVGFLTENIEGITSGLYVLDSVKRRFGIVSSGSFIKKMAHVCLDQEWLRNAGVHFLFIGNPGLLDRTWGPRGYRFAMMAAGQLGQRIYIAATSLKLGCCGIGAFYDREAAELIGLGGESWLLYLVAVGKVKHL